MAWKYQQLLNQNLQILLTLALGLLSVYLKLLRPEAALPTLNTFVFAILLPASVLLGLGLLSDLRDGSTWQFIGGFLMMRAIALAACVVTLGPIMRRGVGAISINWLLIGWVSSVILGVPLVQATLGPQYANLGVVAGISSFIFQLPLMLILFDTHVRQKSVVQADIEGRPAMGDDPTAAGHAPSNEHGAVDQVTGYASVKHHDSGVVDQQKKSVIWKWGILLGKQLVKNPILWSILVGIILSVTTLGPKYLYPGSPPTHPNCSYAPGTGFIFLTLSSFAACTEPVALFATGIFLARRNPLRIGWLRILAYMVAKLVLVPALMVGCAAAVGLQGAPARAAVLLASLPISGAAFTLSDRYAIGQEETVANIFFGNLLVLPTTIAWMSFMDAINLFPAPSIASPNACAASG